MNDREDTREGISEPHPVFIAYLGATFHERISFDGRPWIGLGVTPMWHTVRLYSIE